MIERIRSSRLWIAASVASLVTLVLATHAFTAVNMTRAKVVREPLAAVEGVIEIRSDQQSRTEHLAPPFALIGRTSLGNPAELTVTVDGADTCRRTLPAGTARRFDCRVTMRSAATWYSILIRGPNVPWTLDYLELSTHHGSTTGFNHVLILPRGSTRYNRPPIAALVVCWLLVAWGIAAAPLQVPRWLNVVYRFAAPVVLVVLAAIQCSNWMSEYRIVISTGTLARWIAILLAPSIWASGRLMAILAGHLPPRLIAVIQSLLIAALSVALYNAVAQGRVRALYHGNYSGLLLISQAVFDKNPLLSARDDVRRSLEFDRGGGFDGQFVYFAAFDPLLRAFKERPAAYDQVVDVPPYRFGRIGFSWLTVALSGGSWQRFPVTMLFLILASIGVLSFLLGQMTTELPVQAAAGALVLVIPGFWTSIQSGLPEPLAAAALVAGITCLLHQRWMLAGVLFTLSLLTRETGIVAIACAAFAVSAVDRRSAIVVVTGSALAVFAWRVYVAWILFPEWGLQGLLFHPPDLGWPFAGFLELWRVVGRGDYYPRIPEISRAAVAYPLLLSAGLAASVLLAVKTRNPFAIAGVVYGLVAVSLNYQMIWVHVGNGQRGTYELFLMLALCTVAIRQFTRPLQATVALFWCCSAVYVFALSYDAAYIRASQY
jgi:hypothetical protein